MARQKALSLDAIGRVCAGSAVDVAALELPAEQQLADAAGLLTFNFRSLAAELKPMQTVKDGALPEPAANGGQILQDVLRWCGVDERLSRGTRQGNGWRRSVRRMQLALPCGAEVKVPVVPAPSQAQAKADLARRIDAREVLVGVSIPSRVASLRLSSTARGSLSTRTSPGGSSRSPSSSLASLTRWIAMATCACTWTSKKWGMRRSRGG